MLSLGAASTLALVLVVALIAKLRTPRSAVLFTAALGQFGVPARLRPAVAIAVTAAEAGCVVALVLPLPAPARFGPAAVLLAAFSVALMWAGRGGRAVACHCFGSQAPGRTGPHVAVNAVLVLLAAVAGSPGPRAVTAGDHVLAVGLGLLVGLVAVTAVPLLETLGPISWRRVVPPSGRS